MKNSAILVLQDGTIFYGKNMGIQGITIGEIVFNTAMTGYQEIITDPSYSDQIITFTYPHIGNIGTNPEDEESKKIQVKGIVTKNISPISSNFRSTENIINYIKKNNLIAISNIDTRKLTRIIREKGSQYACIQTGSKIDSNIAYTEINNYIKKKKINLAISCSTKKIYQWKINRKKKKDIKNSYNYIKKSKNQKKKIIVYDLGVKENILNILYKKGYHITIVPAETKLDTILSLNPSGIILSNGPGDPRNCKITIKNTKELLKKKIPIFGICLGHQILALSAGAKIIKMKFGHHGSNHPVKEISTNRVFITSQNHNYTIDPNTINDNINITHKSLFDQSIQGISIKNNYAFSFQGHPESNPGTNDIKVLFDQFFQKINQRDQKCQKEKI